MVDSVLSVEEMMIRFPITGGISAPTMAATAGPMRLRDRIALLWHIPSPIIKRRKMIEKAILICDPT